ncbi:hypothetical protein B0T24DRAFT_113169 [Lasiosphaeria ovina]|uniref:Uncharacterized protein n=1 Tax=Lasiosphaeria ovina TaxID=92902 RepID=A0AAE0MZ48_9PEZI|nr:hypothetical protein B0T24DRAFT_113169 [Lasiosphaeria ovina]
MNERKREPRRRGALFHIFVVGPCTTAIFRYGACVGPETDLFCLEHHDLWWWNIREGLRRSFLTSSRSTGTPSISTTSASNAPKVSGTVEGVVKSKTTTVSFYQCSSAEPANCQCLAVTSVGSDSGQSTGASSGQRKPSSWTTGTGTCSAPALSTMQIKRCKSI